MGRVRVRLCVTILLLSASLNLNVVLLDGGWGHQPGERLPPLDEPRPAGILEPADL